VRQSSAALPIMETMESDPGAGSVDWRSERPRSATERSEVR
jgi:hypothetical protein